MSDRGRAERFTWTADDVTVYQPDVLERVEGTVNCEGCQAKLTGDEAIPGLRGSCADTIDRDTEARLERDHFGGDL